MKERGILFKPPMVREVLADYKTQTRRMPDNRNLKNVVVGDILYVKETWACIDWSEDYEYHDVTIDEIDNPKPDDYCRKRLIYAADCHFEDCDNPEDRGFSWRPSIFIPKWASRIKLLVTGIRDEPLQNLSQEDALAEGIRTVTKDGTYKKHCVLDKGDYSSTPWQDMSPTPIGAFEKLWDSINAKDGLAWATNPVVRVFEFERIKS